MKSNYTSTARRQPSYSELSFDLREDGEYDYYHRRCYQIIIMSLSAPRQTYMTEYEAGFHYQSHIFTQSFTE